MLLVNVHKLDIVLAEAVGLGALEHQVNGIGRVLGLEGEDVFVLGGAEDLGQGEQVDAEGDVTVAAVGGEALSAEKHGDQGNVGVVHGLESDAGVIAVEVAVLDEVLDGVDDLAATVSICSSWVWDTISHTRFRRLACSKRASNTREEVN